MAKNKNHNPFCAGLRVSQCTASRPGGLLLAGPGFRPQKGPRWNQSASLKHLLLINQREKIDAHVVGAYVHFVNIRLLFY